MKIDKTRRNKDPHDTTSTSNIKATCTLPSGTANATSTNKLLETSVYNSASSYMQTTAHIELHKTSKTFHQHSNNNNHDSYSSISPIATHSPKKTNGLTINIESNVNHLSTENITELTKTSPKPVTPIPFNYQLCELTPLSPPSNHPCTQPPTTNSIISTTSHPTSNKPMPIIPSNIFIFPVSPELSERDVIKEIPDSKLEHISVDVMRDFRFF